MINYQKYTIDELIDLYKIAALNFEKAQNKSHYRIANKNQKIISSVYRELRNRGKDAQIKLLTLLENDSPVLKEWVSAHALEFAPEQGIPILEELIKLRGFVGNSARITLEMWRRGELQFP